MERIFRTTFFVMSGGKANTRQMAGAGAIAGAACHDDEKFLADYHEFSGLFDLSGLLRRNGDGNFAMSAAVTGASKLMNQVQVDVNYEYILVRLKAGKLACGAITAFQVASGCCISQIPPLSRTRIPLFQRYSR